MLLKRLSNNKTTRSRQEAIIDFCRHQPKDWFTIRQVQKSVFKGKIVSARVRTLVNSLVKSGYLIRDEHHKWLSDRKYRQVFVYKLSTEVSRLLTTDS